MLARLLAAALAALFTVLGTLLLRATQPAALSTTLFIALGSMQRGRDAVIIMAAVLLMTLLGEPIRRWRLRSSPSYTESDFGEQSRTIAPLHLLRGSVPPANPVL